MSFGIFEAAVSSEQEAGIAKQAATDKLEAAIYDVRTALGPFLFQARSIEEFRDRVAMTKNDNSLYRLIEPHIHPAAGIVRRVAGRNGQLEKEFKAILATGTRQAGDHSTDRQPDDARSHAIPELVHDQNFSPYMDRAPGSPTGPPRHSGSRRQACYPGCEKNEAHAKKFHSKEAGSHGLNDADFGTDITNPYTGTSQGTGVEGGMNPAGELQWNKPASRRSAGDDYIDPDPMAGFGGGGSAAVSGESHDPMANFPTRQADFDGTMDIKNTFKPSDGELIPKDDWEGYRNKVDQNSSKVDRNFTSSMDFRVYADWAEANQAHPMRLATLDAYAGNLSDAAYMRLARAIQAWEFDHKPKAPKGQSKSKLKDVTASEYTDHMFGPGMGGPEHGEEAPVDDSHLHHHRGPSWVKEPEDHWQNDPKTHSYANRRQSGPSPYGGVDDYMGEETGNELGGSGDMDPVTSFGGGPGGYPESHHGRRDPLKQYIAWCTKNNLKRISARNVDYYSRGNPKLAIHLVQRIKVAIHTARQRQAGEHELSQWQEDNYLGDGDRVEPELSGHWGPAAGFPGTPREPEMNVMQRSRGKHREVGGGRRQAAPDYLQKADDALTQLLNQKAEEFQNTIAPLQQALVTVQQAVQLTQQANPLNVLPPPGTVNVMPGQAAPGQVGQPDPSGGQDPAAAAAAALAPAQAAGQLPGGDPSGGAPPPDGGQGAPPPAAMDQGGLPPDPTQQMQARRRGGQGKGRGANRPRQANSVFDLWNKWQGQNTGVGGDADYENFANQFGVGNQALNKLKTHHQQALVTAATDGKSPPNIAEEGVKAQWRMMDAQMSQAGYKFDKGTQHWMKAGQKPIKNPWPHSAGKHDYRHDDQGQIFYPQRGHEGWSHESGPSGPPYVRDQLEPGRHEASRKQAWTGWGPAQFPKSRKVAGWDWVENQNGYAAKSPRRFECSCGEDFPTPTGFHRCACGKSWNSYVIGTGGSNREASTDSFWVREITTRPDVIVAANQRMEAGGQSSGWTMTQPPSDILNTWRDSPMPRNFDDTERKHRELYEQQGKHPYDSAPVDAIHTLMDPRTGQLHDLVDPGELGEGKDPGHPKPKKTTKDWHHRDKNQRWTGK